MFKKFFRSLSLLMSLMILTSNLLTVSAQSISPSETPTNTPSPTVTPQITPSPTDEVSPSLSPISTPTPSETVTPSVTSIPSATVTVQNTAVPSNTLTPSPTPASPVAPPACVNGVGYVNETVAISQGTQLNGMLVPLYRSDTSYGYGPADNIYYTLGKNGSVTYKFAGEVKNINGWDFLIFESSIGRSTYPTETAKVEVSDDNTLWVTLSTLATSRFNGSGVTNIDIAGTGLSKVRYVRLTDIWNPANLNLEADGFDVNAIQARSLDCTGLPTATPAISPSVTPTNSPTPSPTATNTPTPTSTPTNTPTPSPTNTPTSTPTNTPTATPTSTPTNTPTLTPSPTATNTPTLTPSPTNTSTPTPTNTPTNTPTPTDTPTPTPTNVAPQVTAPVTGSVTLPNTYEPEITVTDDGLPNPPGVTSVSITACQQQLGLSCLDNGHVTIGGTISNPSFTFDEVGPSGFYQIKVEADDGDLQSSKTIIVQVKPAPSPTPTATNTPAPSNTPIPGISNSPTPLPSPTTAPAITNFVKVAPPFPIPICTSGPSGTCLFSVTTNGTNLSTPTKVRVINSSTSAAFTGTNGVVNGAKTQITTSSFVGVPKGTYNVEVTFTGGFIHPFVNTITLP